MHVNVLPGMCMYMCMMPAIIVNVQMFMRFISYGLTNPPKKIRKPEPYQSPGREVSSEGFKGFKLPECESKSNTNQSQQYRAEHVPKPAQKGNPHGFGQCPVAGLSDHDKGQIMIGAAERVAKADQRGCSRQNGYGMGHNAGSLVRLLIKVHRIIHFAVTDK
jgi:hypothetical protein